MIGTVPKILHDDTGRGKPIVMTDDLKRFLIANDKEPRSAVGRALGINRKAITRLYDSLGSKRETKKQRAVRKTAEQIVSAMEKVEAQDAKAVAKAKAKAVKEKAKELVKNKKNLMDRLQEPVKNKDGQPINYNGEELTTEAMMDISLINQAKESPQANLYLRAQAMAIDLAEQKKKDLAAKKKMIAQVERKMQTRVKAMRQALTDKGVYLNMLDTMIEAWGDAWSAKEIAKWQWKRTGGDTVEVQITAQAQKLERPNQHYETYRNALKAYNDADQKLRASCNAYYKLAVGDSDEELPGDKATAEILKMLKEED